MFIATILRAVRYLKARLQAQRLRRLRHQAIHEITALPPYLKDDIGVPQGHGHPCP
ncbi:hypothetical protein HFC70_14840 [Agrobacterium sp. a22-2]|uniref:hypothetical protein n=1 Tax=Agrobacterium sp. a22-2 TaxID=2283840 RepID=UPI0014459568|nr:hypothetical protein [Agrobacterium sp. a22-2]NKN37627.1 hypothetical protein [Agrobacterium sp. a22-2]